MRSARAIILLQQNQTSSIQLLQKKRRNRKIFLRRIRGVIKGWRKKGRKYRYLYRRDWRVAQYRPKQKLEY